MAFGISILLWNRDDLDAVITSNCTNVGQTTMQEVSKKKMYPCRNRKSMMTRLQFGLKYSVFRMTLATSATGINLKLSTSPSATWNN